ncbi:MAG: hypothetical protein ISS23_00480 [Nanoarchaeota archaeon]|nr:hypothetical protein [Nanoarchaeota archaeon]
MRFKKAQASGVATFILIMALVMLVYVLLLPQEEREELMGQEVETPEDDDDEEIVEGQINLLYTSPGKVYTYEKNEIKIPINSLNIFARTEEEIKELATKLSVSKSWFSDNPEILTFKIQDKDLLEKLQLFFFVNSGEGTIYVMLNGLTVFEGEISSIDSPINLPSYRAQTTNVLKIGMTSGDFAGDSYTLSAVSLKQSYKSEKNTERRTFQLTSGEKAGLKKSTLEYFINCMKIKPEEQGNLLVLLNGRELSSEHVFCDAGTRTKLISNSDLISGRNTLEFRIDKGEYNIEGIELEIETKEKYYPQYNFELDDEDYESIKEDKEAYIQFKFPNDDDRKKATITINEYQISFDTKDDEYERKISNYLERGTNHIKIIPKLNFEISSLKAYLIEED